MRTMVLAFATLAAVIVAGCQSQNVQAVKDVLDATADAAQRANAVGSVVIETQDGLGYQIAGIGLRPPVKATGVVVYDYRSPTSQPADTVDRP